MFLLGGCLSHLLLQTKNASSSLISKSAFWTETEMSASGRDALSQINEGPTCVSVNNWVIYVTHAGLNHTKEGGELWDGGLFKRASFVCQRARR